MPARAQRARKAAPAARNTKTPRRAEEVLACAVEIFNERGYAATSVGDIADALGILKGSLYYYIESKEDLLFNIVGEVHEASREIVEDALAREDLHARDRLALYVRNQTRYNALNVARVAVYYSDINQLSEPRLKDIRSRQQAHYRGACQPSTLRRAPAFRGWSEGGRRRLSDAVRGQPSGERADPPPGFRPDRVMPCSV